MHAFSPVNSPFVPEVAAVFIPLIAILFIWTIALKGFALWSAARRSQKRWFIALLVINSLGVLEIVYLIWFRKKAVDPYEQEPVLTRTTTK